ncbi:putative transmembrane protein [Thioalkalivibrio nitratireducens DSM 14787]|uniref:Transmembrane protein n=1 Tax=Thioalkalivibrio nitratireducens (strain DSM 14787 / UNIQEM 213 / ALEN2) TaxID=1255043 RepID=L0DR72_THIND|nr:putative transmembrane protein [Thioalkalivibrio nitratireducens DSM 14787]
MYLSRGDDFTDVPASLLDALGRLEFALELGLTPERRLAREDTATVLANLESRGFHLQLPHRGNDRTRPGPGLRRSATGGCAAAKAANGYNPCPFLYRVRPA